MWLSDTDLDVAHLEQALGILHFTSMQGGDIFLERKRVESWSLAEHKVKNAFYTASAGLGVRAMIGEQVGFAYADSLDLNALHEACRFAKKIAHYGKTASVGITRMPHAHTQLLYPNLNPLERWSAQEKVALLQRVDDYAYQQDSRVVDVSCSLSASFQEIAVMQDDGHFAIDVRPMVRFGVNVVLEENGRREQGHAGGGGRHEYAFFFTDDSIFAYVDEALRQARMNLEAIAAPAGQMPVILSNGWSGVLLHEAVGHGLEGDFNRKGTSVFAGKIGEQVCATCCTIIDDGTLQHRRGSLNVDDEGTPSACNVLVENGVLKGYMHDRLNARLMHMPLTGNARRESYAHLPMPRMTNTYLKAGEYAQEEMIRSVKKGLFIDALGGGQVDITNGQFVFAASCARLIENGQLTAPVKGATLIGNGFEVMQNISMVGGDWQLDSGVGICGKDGQSVPVGVGMPSVTIKQITVGGTSL